MNAHLQIAVGLVSVVALALYTHDLIRARFFGDPLREVNHVLLTIGVCNAFLFALMRVLPQ